MLSVALSVLITNFLTSVRTFDMPADVVAAAVVVILLVLRKIQVIQIHLNWFKLCPVWNVDMREFVRMIKVSDHFFFCLLIKQKHKILVYKSN